MNILVCGYYFKGNIGDNYFIDAFHKLFPQHCLTFTDKVIDPDLAKTDAVFLGGGSFLDGEPFMEDSAYQELLKGKIPLMYIGVGADGNIHPKHQELLKVAKLAAVRSMHSTANVSKYCANTFTCPDIVYCLVQKNYGYKKDTVLVIPNTELVPSWNRPHWQHTAWEHFKSEFAQVCDELVNSGIKVRFLPFSKNEACDDSWAAGEIIAKMAKREASIMEDDHCSNFYAIENVLQRIAQHSVVVTQRFHGIVLSELAQTPYVSICHHDKLKNAFPRRGDAVSYYGTNKAEMLSCIRKNLNAPRLKLIDHTEYFDRLKEQVSSMLE